MHTYKINQKFYYSPSEMDNTIDDEIFKLYEENIEFKLQLDEKDIIIENLKMDIEIYKETNTVLNDVNNILRDKIKSEYETKLVNYKNNIDALEIENKLLRDINNEIVVDIMELNNNKLIIEQELNENKIKLDCIKKKNDILLENIKHMHNEFGLIEIQFKIDLIKLDLENAEIINEYEDKLLHITNENKYLEDYIIKYVNKLKQLYIDIKHCKHILTRVEDENEQLHKLIDEYENALICSYQEIDYYKTYTTSLKTEKYYIIELLNKFGINDINSFIIF